MKQAQGGLGQQQPGAQDDQGGEGDDEHAVVAEEHVADREMAEQPGGRIDLNVVRAEYHAETLLHDERHAPSRQQRFEGPAVKEADDETFEDQAGQGCGDEAQRQRKEEVAFVKVVPGAAFRPGRWHPKEMRPAVEGEGQGDGGNEAGAEDVLDDIAGIGADGDHLAVRHVDHPHQAEGDRQPERHDEQDRAQADAVEDRAEEVDVIDVPLDGIDRGLHRRRHLGFEGPIPGEALEGIEGADVVQPGKRLGRGGLNMRDRRR